MQNLKIRLFIFLLVSATTSIGFAQCPTGDITISNQNQVNNFPQTYPNCHRLNAGLFIDGTNVTNLDSLIQIDTIDATLSIFENLQLVSLAGLKNLKSVQDFSISGSPLLTSLKGLDSLKTATNSLVIGQMNGLESLEGIQAEYVRQFAILQCNKLTSLQGLDKLGRVSTFAITQNENLVSFNGVNPRLTFGDHFTINSNPKLVELANFENFDFVYNLDIRNNLVLNNLNGLRNLKRTFYFSLVNNPALENLDILTNLNTIELEMTIAKNAKLKSIEGLANVDAGLLDSISIIDNVTLSMCSMKSVCDFLNLDMGKYSISNNAVGCNDKVSILAQCNTTSSFFEKSNDVTFYPNPATDFVYFKGLKGIRKLGIYHISGILIQSVEVKGDELVLPVDHLVSGIYFLKPTDPQISPSKVMKLFVSQLK